MKTAKLLPKMTTGSIQLQWKRSGRKNCHCALDLMHGPYVVFYWRDAGFKRSATSESAILGEPFRNLSKRDLPARI